MPIEGPQFLALTGSGTSVPKHGVKNKKKKKKIECKRRGGRNKVVPKWPKRVVPVVKDVNCETNTTQHKTHAHTHMDARKHTHTHKSVRHQALEGGQEESKKTPVCSNEFTKNDKVNKYMIRY